MPLHAAWQVSIDPWGQPEQMGSYRRGSPSEDDKLGGVPAVPHCLHVISHSLITLRFLNRAPLLLLLGQIIVQADSLVLRAFRLGSHPFCTDNYPSVHRRGGAC